MPLPLLPFPVRRICRLFALHKNLLFELQAAHPAVRAFFKRALELNSQLDPRQSAIAETLLENC